MGTVQIGVKIDEKIRKQIDDLVKLGKYRNVSDFIHMAIETELNKDAAASEDFRRKLDQSIEEGISEGRYDELLDSRVRKIFKDILLEK